MQMFTFTKSIDSRAEVLVHEVMDFLSGGYAEQVRGQDQGCRFERGALCSSCTGFALHLHFLHFICSISIGSGLNSMYMHARVFISVRAVLYAAPFVNSRAELVPGSTQRA